MPRIKTIHRKGVRIRYVDYGPEFRAALVGGSEAGNIRAARKLRTFSRRTVNRRWHRGGESSRPGEPPKRRSGRGRLSIDAVKLRRPGPKRPRPAKTFSSRRKAPYMALYEFGPPSLRRPWLRVAFEKHRNEVVQLMLEPVKRRLRRRSA